MNQMYEIQSRQADFDARLSALENIQTDSTDQHDKLLNMYTDIHAISPLNWRCVSFVGRTTTYIHVISGFLHNFLSLWFKEF